MSIATSLWETCHEEVARRGGGRLESVTVAVGELSAVEPDLLEFAWEAIVADTEDADVTLEIRWCPARQSCPSCGEVAGEGIGWLRLCPQCQGFLDVAGGDELDIVQLSFQPRESPDSPNGDCE